MRPGGASREKENLLRDHSNAASSKAGQPNSGRHGRPVQAAEAHKKSHAAWRCAGSGIGCLFASSAQPEKDDPKNRRTALDAGNIHHPIVVRLMTYFYPSDEQPVGWNAVHRARGILPYPVCSRAHAKHHFSSWQRGPISMRIPGPTIGERE
jgi:hypothetical protein